jgi:hypothetical protein
VVDAAATAELRAEQPLGRFNGLGTYLDRNHLAFAQVAEIWRTAEGFGDAVRASTTCRSTRRWPSPSPIARSSRRSP